MCSADIPYKTIERTCHSIIADLRRASYPGGYPGRVARRGLQERERIGEEKSREWGSAIPVIIIEDADGGGETSANVTAAGRRIAVAATADRSSSSSCSPNSSRSSTSASPRQKRRRPTTTAAIDGNPGAGYGGAAAATTVAATGVGSTRRSQITAASLEWRSQGGRNGTDSATPALSSSLSSGGSPAASKTDSPAGHSASRPLLRRQKQIQHSSSQMLPRPPGQQLGQPSAQHVHLQEQQQQRQQQQRKQQQQQIKKQLSLQPVSIQDESRPHMVAAAAAVATARSVSPSPHTSREQADTEGYGTMETGRYRQFWRNISQESTEEISKKVSPSSTSTSVATSSTSTSAPKVSSSSSSSTNQGDRIHSSVSSSSSSTSHRDTATSHVFSSPPIQRATPKGRELLRWSSASGPSNTEPQFKAWPPGRVSGHMSSPLAGTPMASRAPKSICRFTSEVRNSHPELRYGRIATEDMSTSHLVSVVGPQQLAVNSQVVLPSSNPSSAGQMPSSTAAPPGSGPSASITSEVGRDNGESVGGGGGSGGGGGGGVGGRSNTTSTSSAILYDLHQQHQSQQPQHQQQQPPSLQISQQPPLSPQPQQPSPHAQTQSQCGPAVAYPHVAFQAVAPYIRQQSDMQFCFSQNSDKPPLSKTFSLPHDYESQKPLGYRPLATAADAAFGGAFLGVTAAKKSDGISCPNLGRRPEVSYRKDKMATSEETQSLLSELVSEEDSSYSLFDITGPSGQSGEARFPWQRDVGVQCDFSNTTQGTCGQSGLWSLSGLDRDRSPGPGPWKPDVSDSSGCSKCVLQTMKRSSISMQEGLCLEVPPFEGVSVSTPALHHTQDPWTSLENIVPDRGNLTSAHGTECRLYCSLHNTEKSYRCPEDEKRVSEQSTTTRHLRPTDLGLYQRRGSATKWFAENDSELQDRTYRADSLVSPPPGVYPRYARILGNPDIPQIDTPSSSDLGERSDTLSSPRVSPVPWLSQGQSVPELVITSISDSQEGTRRLGTDPTTRRQRFLTVPKTVIRRPTSGSLQSVSDESDTEPSTPPVARRGRRPAVFDSKSLGLAATHLDDISPSNSCDEDGGTNIPQGRMGRKRSSVDLGINYPGDLLVKDRQKKQLIKRNTIADFAATKTFQASTQSLISEQETKKIKVPSIFRLIDKRSHRSKDSLSLLTDVLTTLKPSAFRDTGLQWYKDQHWTDLVGGGKDTISIDSLDLTETERKRREAVWELFRSETVFLVDYLMVLKHCFLEPLKKVSVEGHMMFAEPQDLFGNLDELCYVSYTFCRDFINLLLKDATPVEFGRTEVLIQALTRYCQLSRDGEVYHNYCLNYSKAMNHLEQIRKKDDWCEFEKWCEQDLRCHRLQLTDLLISPMQHCTKVPLLLNNIRKYTEDQDERQQLTESLNKLETSLKNLEAKMKWLKNFERVQQIQQQIIWQPITELEPRAFIPEFLKGSLCRQPCERLLASPKRQLLYEGPLTLVEISKTVDMYLFLFDDILLLTKVKKPPRKKSSLGDNNPMMPPRGSTEGAIFVVYRQPIALDRFTLHDVQPAEAAGFWEYFECGVHVSFDQTQERLPDMEDMTENYPHRSNLFLGCLSAANGLRHAFVLVQISRFQQIIGVYTLQAPSETAKAMWLSHLKDAQDKYKDACSKNADHGYQSSPGSPRGSLIPDMLRPHSLLDRTQSSPSRTYSPSTKESPLSSKREIGAGSAHDSRGASDQGAVNQTVSGTPLAELAIQETTESDSSGAAAGETDTPPMPRPLPITLSEPGTSTSSTGFYSPQLLRPRSRTPTETKSISPPPTPGRPRSRDRHRRLNTLKALHEKAKSMDIVFI